MFDIKSQPKSNIELSANDDKLGEISCGQSKIKNLQEKSIGFGEEFDKFNDNLYSQRDEPIQSEPVFKVLTNVRNK